jgi:hypothetical protein
MTVDIKPPKMLFTPPERTRNREYRFHRVPQGLKYPGGVISLKTSFDRIIPETQSGGQCEIHILPSLNFSREGHPKVESIRARQSIILGIPARGAFLTGEAFRGDDVCRLWSWCRWYVIAFIMLDEEHRMVVRRAASAAALAPPARHIQGVAMFGDAASNDATPRAAAGPLSWSVGRRLAWTGAACLLLWSAVLWALS